MKSWASDEATLVPIDEPDALARAIAATLGDPVAARERAAAARSRFLDCFTIERVADRMVAFYESVGGNKNGV